MRQAVKPRCRYGCRFLDITPELSLCPHAAFGWASNLKGAVEEARALLERQGGYDALLAGEVAKETARKEAKREQAQRYAATHKVKHT